MKPEGFCSKKTGRKRIAAEADAACLAEERGKKLRAIPHKSMAA